MPSRLIVATHDPKQAHRIRRLLMAANASSIVIALLFIAYLLDVLTLRAFVNAALLTFFFVIAFYAAFRSGLNLRFRDSSLTLPQILCSTRASLRGTDLLGRYGGEEFMAVRDQTPLDKSAVVAGRLCALANTLTFDAVPAGLRLSVSIAGAEYGKSEQWQATVERADQALYRAKYAGRDRFEPKHSTGESVVVGRDGNLKTGEWLKVKVRAKLWLLNVNFCLCPFSCF